MDEQPTLLELDAINEAHGSVADDALHRLYLDYLTHLSLPKIFYEAKVPKPAILEIILSFIKRKWGMKRKDIRWRIERPEPYNCHCNLIKRK